MVRTSVVLTIAALACMALPASAQKLSFSQINYYNNGVLAVPDSEWGQLDITYTPTSSLKFLNVIENPGTSSAQWIIRNDPILSSADLGTSSFESGMYFDLGTARGTKVTSIDVSYGYNSVPLLTDPTGLTKNGIFTLGTTQAIINSGVPSGDNTLAAGALPPAVVPAGNPKPAPKPQTLERKDMPNVIQSTNFCGPAAAANSIQWLAAKNGYKLNQTPLQTENELATDTKNKNKGNWDDTEISGKKKYIKDHKLPLDVHYRGGFKVKNNGPVTFAWIKQELTMGQDVEIMTKTHWVVVSGFVDGGAGAQQLQYRDDPFQKGAKTTKAQQAVIDKRFIWTNFANGFVNIGNGNEKVLTAVAESPTPEPSTLASFTIGIIGMVRLMVKRKRLKA